MHILPYRHWCERSCISPFRFHKQFERSKGKVCINVEHRIVWWNEIFFSRFFRFFRCSVVRQKLFLITKWQPRDLAQFVVLRVLRVVNECAHVQGSNKLNEPAFLRWFSPSSRNAMPCRWPICMFLSRQRAWQTSQFTIFWCGRCVGSVHYRSIDDYSTTGICV